MNNYSYNRGEKMKEELCESTVIHKDTVEKVKKQMHSDELLFDLAELFKIFGDSTRMKIICALKMSELCVCDIASITNSTQSAISHQLRILKQAKLIRSRKDGKVVYYSLADDHVEKIFEIGCEHLEEV